MKENSGLRNLKSREEIAQAPLITIPGDMEKGWFQCGIWELNMNGDEGLPAEGASRKGKESYRVMATGSLGQK